MRGGRETGGTVTQGQSAGTTSTVTPRPPVGRTPHTTRLVAKEYYTVFLVCHKPTYFCDDLMWQINSVNLRTVLGTFITAYSRLIQSSLVTKFYDYFKVTSKTSLQRKMYSDEKYIILVDQVLVKCCRTRIEIGLP